MALPAKLVADGFTFVRALTRQGGEADILLARDPDGVEKVVKRYRERSFQLDPDIAQRLIDSDHEHIVGLERVDGDDGLFWELLEYVPLGNLMDYRTSGGEDPEGRIPVEKLEKVVRELSDAIDYTHNQLALVHCDIKPDNILVRSDDEDLDLVLADFGLMTPISVAMATEAKSRTPAYAPPEAIAGAVSPGRDWWSLGMVILEALTGQHPFAVKNRWLNEDEITFFLSTQSVPVSRVENVRWQNLCRGLLTRAPDKRWSKAEVDQWLAGGNPKIHDSLNTGASRPYDLHGRLAITFEELALALRADWRSAARRLADPERVAELREWLADAGAPQSAIDACSTQVPLNSPDYRLALLITRLAPQLQPVFIELFIERNQLIELCRAVIYSSGEGPEVHLLDVLRSTSALEVFGKFGDLNLESLSNNWRLWIDFADSLTGRFIPPEFQTFSEEQRLAVDARLLLCLLSPEEREATRTAASSESIRFFAVEWYKRLAQYSGKQAAEDIRDVLVLAYRGRVETIAEHAAPMPRVEEFRVTPDVAVEGAGVWLSWRVLNADRVVISALGSVDSEGRVAIPANRSQSYVLDAINSNGRVQVPSNLLTVLRMPPVQMPIIPFPQQNITLSVDSEMAALSALPTPFAKSPPIAFLPELDPEPVDPVATELADLAVPALPVMELPIPSFRPRTFFEERESDE